MEKRRAGRTGDATASGGRTAGEGGGPEGGRWRVVAPRFYARPAEEVARDLLGRYLVRRIDGGRRVLRIVEAEAYLGAPDRASHAWGGRRTERVESLYLPGGHAYVYFVYGMHWCFNVVTGEADVGSAVLIRAGEAVEGAEAMWRARGRPGRPRAGELAGGPARLCQALGIDRELDGVAFEGVAGRGRDTPLAIATGEPVAATGVATGPRVGVAYAGEAAEWPLRFAIRGHPEVSRPRL